MPRQARTTSATCVYHTILRGVNKQQVFEDEEDYLRFLNVLRRQTQLYVDDQGRTLPPRCYIYAYSLMGNHIHLLVKEGSETIGEIMKRIASSYVYHYNHKYDRVGHLEEDANQFIDVDVHPTKSTYSDEEIWQLLSALSGASNATQFQALPRPLQKQYLFSAHEEGIGPRILSRLTGVPYSIVQRATSGTFRSNGMVCEPLPNDEELETYIDCAEYEKYPEY